MNAPSETLLQDLKRQELIANDKLRAASILRNIQASLSSKPEVTSVSSALNIRG